MKKQLEELEKKVMLVIENNRKLRAESSELKKENKLLAEAKAELESSLLKEHSAIDSLSKEKDSIRGAIESLLRDIGKLEAAK